MAGNTCSSAGGSSHRRRDILNIMIPRWCMPSPTIPMGPFVVYSVIGNGHNPEAYRAKDGSWILFVNEAVFLADDLSGPWRESRMGYEFRDIPNTRLVNHTFAPREDGSVLLVSRQAVAPGVRPYLTNRMVASFNVRQSSARSVFQSSLIPTAAILNHRRFPAGAFGNSPLHFHHATPPSFCHFTLPHQSCRYRRDHEESRLPGSGSFEHLGIR